MAGHRRQTKDKGCRQSCSEGGVVALGDAHKRAQTQKLSEHKIIHQQGPEQYQTEICHAVDLKPWIYLTAMPGVAPLSGDSKKMSASPGPAASTMPSDTPKRIFRGARLATTTVNRSTRSSGV